MLGRKRTSTTKGVELAERELTRPARAIESLTNPKLAKRTMTVVKIAAPVLAPYLLAASTGARGFLDQQRANRLGVPVAEVGTYRGPTGPTGARISGLRASVDELAARKGSQPAVSRFAQVARGRLADLTTAVQAAASMPGGERRSVLRAVNRELDQLSADLMTHLIGLPLS
jgi:hypothetical protein